MTLEYEEVLYDTEKRNKMGTTRKKIDLVPGVKYRGTGCITEYGEFDFVPEQKGTKPNNMKLVKETDDFSLYESKDFVKVTVKIPKVTKKTELISKFMKSFTNAVLELKNYEF